MGTWCYDQVLSRLRGYRKIREGLHGACDHHRVSWSHKLLSFSNITANNTFHTPTGPTLLIVCHIAVMTAVAYGSYPSTHLTKYCLSKRWRQPTYRSSVSTIYHIRYSPSHFPICRPLYPLILEQTGRLQQPLHQNKFQSPKTNELLQSLLKVYQ